MSAQNAWLQRQSLLLQHRIKLRSSLPELAMCRPITPGMSTIRGTLCPSHYNIVVLFALGVDIHFLVRLTLSVFVLVVVAVSVAIGV